MSTEELNDQADFADDELIIRKKKQPEQKTGVTAAEVVSARGGSCVRMALISPFFTVTVGDLLVEVHLEAAPAVAVAALGKIILLKRQFRSS